ncbi:MAG: hypothetical protein RIQ79_635 [Verrucomicrobiota bacterium]
MLSSLLVVLAIGLFCLPIWRLHAPDGRLAAFDQREWPTGRNLVLVLLDLARALGGAWLLAKGIPDLPLLNNEHEWLPDLGISIAVGLGLIVQTFGWTDEDHVQAPLVFVAGVAAVLVDPVVAALVGALAIGAALALRAWSAVFLAVCVGTILIGWLLNAQSWSRVIFLGVAMGLPVVLSILAGRHMGWPRK